MRFSESSKRMSAVFPDEIANAEKQGEHAGGRGGKSQQVHTGVGETAEKEGERNAH